MGSWILVSCGGALIHIILVIVVIAVVIKLVVRSTGVGVQMHMETLEQSLLKLPIQETLLGNARTQPFSALGR